MSSLRIFEPTKEYKVQEDIYQEYKTRSGQVYEIAEIKKLPIYKASNHLSNDWEWKSKSLKKLVSYLKKRTKKKSILVIECGTGWLANHLSKLKNTEVFGVGSDLQEIRQGHDAFTQENLHFIYGNIFEDILFDARYDYIILEDAIHYFQDLSALLKLLRSFLKDKGEIHILDSSFYRSNQLSKAKEKSKVYFKQLAVPEMQKYYHFHTTNEIKKLGAIQKNNSPDSKVKEFLFKLFNIKDYHKYPWYIVSKK